MRRIILIALFLFVWPGCISKSAKTRVHGISFVGVVEKIGRNPGGPSGLHAAYQLVRYRIEEICEGNYVQNEIVVDHLIGDGNELKDINVGEHVCLTVDVSKTIFVRNNEEGFRNPEDNVEFFFIGGRPTKVTKAISCQQCQ